MDLSTSVIIPREDFLELQEVAFTQTYTGKDRLYSIGQTSAIFAVMAGAITAASWGWAKAIDWREERALKRDLKREEAKVHPRPTAV